ncbi:MAG: hypothetical protein JXR40_03930 [Pontiellaceae bacterium]|nr:hypothetical protein [Pontiellaceae bacterium]
MQRSKKHLWPMMISISAIGFLNGCRSVEPNATFNPQAVYRIPPEGLLLSDLVDDATNERTGPIWVHPGAFVFCAPDELSE